jgi:hypothetical protein
MDELHSLITPTKVRTPVHTPRRRRTFGSGDLRKEHRSSRSPLSLKAWARALTPEEVMKMQRGNLATPKAMAILSARGRR